MADSIKIEIPVSVQDQTDPALSNITNKLTQLSTASTKANNSLGKLGRSSGLEKSLGKNGSHTIDIKATDHASQVLHGVEDTAARVGGVTATVDVTASDSATEGIANVEDAAASLNGETANVDLGADDNATEGIADASDALSQFNGSTGTADIDVQDNATEVIHSAMDAGAEFDGQTFTAAMEVTGNASNAMDNATQSAASGAQSAVMGAAGFAGLTLGVGSALTSFGDFEAGMSQVAAISGASGAELEALTQKAKEMGATTKFTATESAEAFNYMAMAGWKSNDMLGGIEGIMNLAAASGESLGTTSDIVTDAITAFGLTAQDSGHFADVMAQTAANANTNVSMMGESFKYVGPLAGAMGYSIEDVSLALGLMANAGVKSSMAGTSLRTAISNLAAPTDNMKTAMDKYGISLTNQDGTMKSLAEVMTNVRDSLGGLAEDEQAAAVKTIFGKNAMSGMLAIINASEEDYNALADSIDNADGAAGRMSETMMDNMKGSLTIMQSAFEGFQNTLGGRLAPYVTDFADAVAAALPGLGTAVDSIMDDVDTKIDAVKQKATNMFNSEEWKNADFLGKVNIAWDTLIWEPFSEWATGEGLTLVSDTVAGLFSEAFKILPGGEEAGLTSWLSAGIIADVGVKAAHGISTLTASLSEFAPWAGPAAGAALAVAGGFAAVAIAIDQYNQKQVKTSLSEHFGNIELSDAQAAAVANQILDAEWTVNIGLAVGEVTGADTARATAEAALADNDALEYKNSVGITLTADEQAAYTDNITTFVNSKIEELEGRTYAAHLMVDTMLDTPEGETLASKIDEWAAADNLELTGLSSQLTEAVDAALSDGIISIDEQAHISELQDKMNSILTQWKQAEADAAMDLISQKYGSLSGAQLTGESFMKVVESLQEQREMNSESLDQASLAFYETLSAMNQSGRLAEAGLDYETLKNQWAQAVRNEEAKSLSNSLQFEQNTLNDTYGDLISSNTAENAEGAKNGVEYLNNEFRSGNTDLQSAMENQSMNMYSTGGGADQAALGTLYESMKPDATAMGQLIDEYVATGQAVPQALMDSFNSTMAMGAAAGDTDAAWQMYANELVASGDQALIEGIQSGTITAPEEMKSALQRSLAETTDEPLTVDGLTAEVEGVETDATEVAEEVGSAVEEAASEATPEAETNASVTITDTETDAESAYQEASTDTQEAFGSEIEATGTANVDLEQENNADGLRSEVQSDIDGALSGGFSTSANVVVTLNWTISNPTASISVSAAGGTATATIASAATNAWGSYVDGPLLSWVGEDGPEYIIPVGSDKHARGLDLWMQAGEALGVGAFADGGAVGPVPISHSGDAVPVSSGQGAVMSPNINLGGTVFNIKSENPTDVMKEIHERIDDIAADLADRLSEVYEATPVA